MHITYTYDTRILIYMTRKIRKNWKTIDYSEK